MTGEHDIGLIGIGLLGNAIAIRLLQQEQKVVGFDVRDVQRNALASAGGVACENAAAVVRRCPVVLISLPTSDIVADVFQQVRPRFQPGQVVVDTTTGDPDRMIAIWQSLSALGVHYVESTVAGSSVQVREGQATLFVGGESEAVGAAERLLSLIADNRFRLGPVGSASRFKLVHNLILGLNRAVLAEGLTFAQALGFDAQSTLEILQQTPAASSVMPIKGPKMVLRDYAPQAKLSQHLKDVRLMLAEAQKHAVGLPLSRLHEKLLQQAVELGFGDADNSAIVEAFAQTNDA